MDVKKICETSWSFAYEGGYSALELEFRKLVAGLGLTLQKSSFRVGISRLISLSSNGRLRPNRDVKSIKSVGDGELLELRFSCLSCEQETIGAKLFCVIDLESRVLSVIGVHAKTNEGSEVSRARQNAALTRCWANFKIRTANENC